MDSTRLAFTLDLDGRTSHECTKRSVPFSDWLFVFGGSGNLGKDAGSRVITLLCRKNCCCYQGGCKTVRLPLLMPFGSVFELESQQLHPKHAWEVRLQTFSDQTSSQDSNATSLHEMRCKSHMDTIFDAKLGTDAACVACPALLMWISAPGPVSRQDSAKLRGWVLHIDAMASGVRSKILEHKSTLSLQQNF